MATLSREKVLCYSVSYVSKKLNVIPKPQIFYQHEVMLQSKLTFGLKLGNFTPMLEDDKNKNRPKQKEVLIRLFQSKK